VGEEYNGVIAAVVPFGFFVELSDIYIEGLVHVSTLSGDYFHHDAAKHRLIGERTAVSFRLGDEVRVKVVRVDLEDRKIDLELVSTPKKRTADRDALDMSKRESRGRGDRAGKGGKGGKRTGKPASAKEKLAAEAARDAARKGGKGKSPAAGKKRKPRK
jgi:ribonuclease R